MNASELKQMVEGSLDELADAVERGESEQLKRYLVMLARFHRYSLGNVLLIGWQRPDATRVAGFHTWKKFGRRVKRGEKGIRILAPVVSRRKRRNRDEQHDEGQTEDTEEGEAEEEVAAFRSVCVFDVAQTEGELLPEFARAEGAPGEYTERLKQLIRAKGIDLAYSGSIGTAEGLSAGGRIVLRKGLKPAEEFSVLVHEFAHELLHQDSAAREQSKTVREVEAEAVAFVVCQAACLDARHAATDYVKLYNGDKKTLMASLGRIRQTAVQIIGGIEPKARGRQQTGGARWQASISHQGEATDAA